MFGLENPTPLIAHNLTTQQSYLLNIALQQFYTSLVFVVEEISFTRQTRQSVTEKFRLKEDPLHIKLYPTNSMSKVDKYI